MTMDVSFKDSSRRKKQFKYLTFLPKHFRQVALYALIANLVTLALSLLFFPSLQKKIPLFYSLPDTQQLVGKEAILILPGLASLINIIHFFIIKKFKSAHLTILQVFLISTLVLEILILSILLRLLIILT
ncbi:MAG: hypothetical protein GX943_00800 [Candidatus Pacebacteria bacterium]|jgi:hypothetical protein|nr:hypothetical protein [Candidatus Paceibacterota bacterium]